MCKKSAAAPPGMRFPDAGEFCLFVCLFEASARYFSLHKHRNLGKEARVSERGRFASSAQELAINEESIAWL